VSTNVSFINMKGGVGKTTLAMQVALAADKANLKVLAVDLDPQSNLSQAVLGARAYLKHLTDEKPTIVDVFEGYVPTTHKKGSPTALNPEEVILHGVSSFTSSTLDLIPSRLELSNSLRNPTGKERRLAKLLSKVANQYDLVVIDCAPTDSILTDSAYFASRYVFIPIKPEFMATIGLPLLARSLERFKAENEDHVIEICGIGFVHSSTYSNGPEGLQSIQEVTEFAEAQGWKVFDHPIRYSGSYPRAARERSAISHTNYAQWPTISGFEAFKDELFEAIGLEKAEAKAAS